MGFKLVPSEVTPFDRSLNYSPNPVDRGLEQRRRIAQQRLTAKRNRRIALFPIIFFQVYLGLSILTFAFGPWAWPVSNPWQLYTFLFLAQVALFTGYRSALNKQPRSASIRIRIPTIVVVSLVFNYVWIGQTYKVRTGESFGLSTAIKSVNSGLSDPGSQYDDRQRNSLVSGGDTTVIDYVNLLLYPLFWLAFPLGVFFWKQLPVLVRVALVGWIVIDLFMWIATGTNKGIADYVLLLPWLLVARKPAMLMKIRPRNVIVIGLIAIIGFAALFAFFSSGMLGRSGGSVTTMYDYGADISADPDNLALRYLPPRLQGTLASFTSYFIQGYYGLSLALQQPFVFCYGVGNSFFLEGLSRHVVATPIITRTYPARIEGTGWEAYRNWHSIYPWIASDLSFPGTLVFMFVIGRLFALVWLDVAFCRNHWAVCLLPLLLTMLFYVPANNQVLAFPGSALPFWALLCVWLYSRKGGRRANRRPVPA
jgi:hypothetical protein